jgi:hypothetical protein
MATFPVTTNAIGEETVTSDSLGEESTTNYYGEEGYSTDALGEEGPIEPVYDQVQNPFGEF